MKYINSYTDSFKTALQTIFIGEYYKYVRGQSTYYYYFRFMNEDMVFYDFYSEEYRDELRKSKAFKESFASTVELIPISKEEYYENALFEQII